MTNKSKKKLKVKEDANIDFNTVKGIIFDCDGVLVDSEPFSCYALNVLFEKYFNIKIGSDYSAVFGKTLQDTFSYYFKQFNLTNINETIIKNLYSEKDEVYKDLARNKLKAFNGIPRLINYCHKFDITVAVASSGTLDKIKFSLTETGLLNYFNIITSSNEIKKGKPDPELFLLSAEKMNLDPKNCLVIEDSISGIVAGNLAQMFTVGVTNTFSKDELQKSTPNLIVNNVSELL